MDFEKMPSPQDLHYSDQNARTTYYQAGIDEKFDDMVNVVYESEGVIKDNLKGKAVVEELYNQYNEAILQLETYNQVGVHDILAQHLIDYNIDISQVEGLGDYNAAAEYKVGNIVIYETKSYFVKSNPPVGTLPTDTNYFVELGLKGDKGITSLGFSGCGAWNSETEYPVDFMVTHDDDLYIALEANTNQTPSDDSTYWKKVISFNKSSVKFSSTAPTYNADGALWMQQI